MTKRREDEEREVEELAERERQGSGNFDQGDIPLRAYTPADWDTVRRLSKLTTKPRTWLGRPRSKKV